MIAGWLTNWFIRTFPRTADRILARMEDAAFRRAPAPTAEQVQAMRAARRMIDGRLGR